MNLYLSCVVSTWSYSSVSMNSSPVTDPCKPYPSFRKACLLLGFASNPLCVRVFDISRWSYVYAAIYRAQVNIPTDDQSQHQPTGKHQHGIPILMVPSRGLTLYWSGVGFYASIPGSYGPTPPISLPSMLKELR